MNDRDREDARLEEVRRRARELRQRPATDQERSRERKGGPTVTSWRPAGHSGPRQPWEQRYPGSMTYPGGYPGMMGGYPGFAGTPTPVGLPFEPGYRAGAGPMHRGGELERERRETWSPRAQVFDREGTMIVRIELPGLDRKDVDVRVEDQILVVEGERQDDRPEGGHRSEWGYGPFRREIALPQAVDPSALKGRFRNGLLEVSVPQPPPEERRKKIKVEAA